MDDKLADEATEASRAAYVDDQSYNIDYDESMSILRRRGAA